MQGLVIAGTASTVGKTIATLSVIAALQDRGVDVQPAKVGPDFIDPSHHETVANRPSRCLDPWMQGEAGMIRNYHRGDGDICVVEGMMGLYDGGEASTVAVADILDLPVVLVVDGNAGSESVAATALGFQQYADVIDRDIDVVGVIAQRTHEGRHARSVREAIPDTLEYLGHIPPSEDLTIPDRHLGLHLGDETAIDADTLRERTAGLALDRLQALMEPGTSALPVENGETRNVRIAVAQDPAFRFIYPATRERLADRAEIVTFAPTAGDPLPVCDALYLPGGYPELHAESLAGSPALRDIGTEAADGLPILGECGGLMALTESLRTTEGESYDMAGVLPATVRMSEEVQAIDHVAYEATASTIIASAGEARRGHEFHYSRASLGTDARLVLEMERGMGIDGERDGLTEYATLGTYSHVHPASGAFDTLIETTVV